MLQNKKFLTIALVISLAINLFIVGVAGFYGAKFRGMGRDGNWIESRMEYAENRFMRHLDDEDKAVARATFDKHKPALRQAFDDHRQARRDIVSAFNQETPEPSELTAALNKSQAATQLANENLHSILRELASGLSPEARQEFASRVRDHHPHLKDD